MSNKVAACQTCMLGTSRLVHVTTPTLCSHCRFAIVDMNLFGNLRYGPNLNSYANFEDFPGAMLTLFR